MFYKKQEPTPTPIPKDLTLKSIINWLSTLAVMPHPQFPNFSTWCDSHAHTAKLHEGWQIISKPLPNYVLTTPKGCSHFIEKLSLSRWTKNLASGARKLYTETQSGVKDAR